MHNSLGNRLISYLSQCSSASVKPHLYPCPCNSQTYFPRHERNRRSCQQSLLTIGPVFIYKRAGPQLRVETHLVSTKCHYGYPFDKPKLLLSVFLSACLDGWQYPIDLFCSCPVVWNHTLPLNVWWLSAHNFGIYWVHGLLVGFLDVTGTICRCHK